MSEESFDPQSDDQQQLDAIIAEYLTAVESGHCPDRQAMLRRYPDLADPLARFFADHDHFQHLAGPLQAEVPCPGPNPTPGALASTRGFTGLTPSLQPCLMQHIGDYELVGEIARGGMGVVYRALQVSLNRPVALKMILAGRLASAADIDRFHREAEAAARLDHPNIVPIYEVGACDGHHYFSMKLIDGGDLTQHLHRFVGNPRATARLVADVAQAVHHAHQRGILHRDLKPRNILLDDQFRPQVTDFGLAKLVESDAESTQSGAIVGTANYMSPEQARGEKSITTAVDVYSLGAILFELLTGRPVFQQPSPAETIFHVLHTDPSRPRALQLNVDRDLETICLKCLEKEPSRRYGSAAALADDLHRWLDGLPITARPVSHAERLWRWCRRKPVLAGAGAVILLMGALFSWTLWRENQHTRTALNEKIAALEESRLARDQSQDLLGLSYYQQARAMAVSAEPGSRWQILDLVRKAEQLRVRQRESPNPPTSREDSPTLPTQAALRSEAAKALLMPDIRLDWQHRAVETVQPGLSPDGRLAVFRAANSIAIIDLCQHREIGRWQHPNLLGLALAVDASGQRLASFNPLPCRLSLCNLADPAQGQLLPWPDLPNSIENNSPQPGFVLSSELLWSPSGDCLTAIDRRAALDGRQSLVLWNLADPSQPRSLITVPEDTDRGGACFTADGSKLAYPTADATVTLWNAPAGAVADQIELPLPIVGRVVLDRLGHRAVCPCGPEGAHQGTVLVWNLVDRREESRIPVDFSLRGSVVALHPSGGRLALGTRQGRVCIFELATARKSVDLPDAHPSAVAQLTWSNDARQLVSWGVLDGDLKCWQLGEPSVTELRTGLKIRQSTLSPDGRWLAVSDARLRRVRIFDRLAGSLHRELWSTDPPEPGLLIFSPDSRQLAEIDAYRVLVWDVESGQFLARLEQASGLEGLITSIGFGPEGNLLASVCSAKPPHAVVWDVLRARTIWTAPATMRVDTALLVPPGRHLATISQDASTNQPANLTLLDLATGLEISQSTLPGRPFHWQSFSPDGHWLAMLRRKSPGAPFVAIGPAGNVLQRAEVVLQSFPAANRLVSIDGPSLPTAVAFTPDSQQLAVGYRDGTVSLHRVHDATEILHLRLHARPISQLAFGKDAQTLAMTDGEGIVQLVDLAQLVCALADLGLGW